jgi:hypothetical protein
MKRLTVALFVLGLVLLGCSKETPMQPHASQLSANTVQSVIATLRNAPVPVVSGKPGYEPAYVDGQTVTINAIDVPNHAPTQAQADFYEVVYPIGWESLGLAAPQCNPCDHEGNGIDFTDFHDHVLDSAPSIGKAGDFRPLWHVNLVIPAYSGNATADAAVSAAYATHLPAKSESAVDDLLAARDADGHPIAVKIDTQFYFLCAIVSPHAAR